MTKVLFILKCRDLPYNGEQTPLKNRPYSYCMASGLMTSATFVSNMLNEQGIESNVIQVIDNNDIDREVTKYKPTHVMIEALWVVPEKFKILRKLHPHVKWIIRLHSEIPFLANEGIAVRWINEYMAQPNVFVAPNSDRLYDDLKHYFKAIYHDADEKLIYLPNYYHKESEACVPREHNVLNIGCFGAIRPLKNQLIQAFAAIEYARTTHKKLKFHINFQRVEQSGNAALENLRALFHSLDPAKYELVEHPWMHHNHFRKLVKTMDVGLQVSLTETFNIVTGDFVSQDVPVVVSNEVDWVSSLFYAETGSAIDIAAKIGRALTLGRIGTYFNKLGLHKYNKEAVRRYIDFLVYGHH